MNTYLKGSLHLHTNLSDGNATPEEVAKIYKNLGYDFIVFTDHRKNYLPENYFINPINDFISIPGAEQEFVCENHFNNMANIHICAIDYLGEFCDKKVVNIPDTINEYLKETYRVGAIPQINHPNWGGSRLGFSFNYAELLNVDYPFMLEIVNCCFGDNNEGNAAFESCEYMWDVLLSNGKTVYGTMTDDTHLYHGQEWLSEKLMDYSHPFLDRLFTDILKGFLPGNGFVMVNAQKNRQSIREALVCGDFYGSNGLIIDNYEYDDKSIKVSLQKQNEENNRIIFKGKMGIPLKIVDGDEAEYEFTNSADEEYVRVKVINGDSKVAIFQPIFRDGRKTRLEI